MKIMEVDTGRPDRLLGLAQFLAGRATDTAAKKQISQQAFVKLAQELGINVTDSNLADVVNQPPLSNLFEPLDPATGMITFKGGEKEVTQMPVNKAQDIVAKMAKKANTLT
jgi:hypothetical protein